VNVWFLDDGRTGIRQAEANKSPKAKLKYYNISRNNHICIIVILLKIEVKRESNGNGDFTPILHFSAHQMVTENPFLREIIDSNVDII
jgi:hypothetical protein